MVKRGTGHFIPDTTKPTMTGQNDCREHSTELKVPFTFLHKT
jgi:hypothetical protein